MLVFLAGAAGAGLVATDLALTALEGFRLGRGVGSDRLAGRRLGTGRGSGLFGRRSRILVLVVEVFGAFAAGIARFLTDFFTQLATRQHGNGFLFQAAEQQGEHVERFALILVLGILLRIAAQRDALAQ